MRKSRTPLVLVAVLALVASLSGTPLGATQATAHAGEAYAFPGVMFFIEGRSGSCTLAFLGRVRATSPEEQDRFFALTAGHCFLGTGEFEAQWANGAGPLVSASTPRREPIGHVVYAEDRAPELPVDIALIELDDDVAMDPAVCFFGGPTGTDTDRRSGSEMVSYVGTGLLLNSRRGQTDDLRNDRFAVVGPVSQGDSGGPVLSEDGRALGIISSVGATTTDDGGVLAGMFAVRIDAMLDRVAAKTGLTVEILTAPLSGKQWPADAVGAVPECAVS